MASALRLCCLALRSVWVLSAELCRTHPGRRCWLLVLCSCGHSGSCGQERFCVNRAVHWTQHREVRFLILLVIRRSSCIFLRTRASFRSIHLVKRSGYRKFSFMQQCVCIRLLSPTTFGCCSCTALLPSEQGSVHPKWFNYISSLNHSN